MDNQWVDDMVQMAKVLSDPSRVLLLLEIYQRGRLRCEEAEAITGLSQPTVSHHLKLLGESGLIHTEKRGRHLLLSPNIPAIEGYMDLFTDLLSERKKG